MVLKPQVVDAFKVLGVESDADEAVACRAYKKLALLHHPDRNRGDPSSTARFQQIGTAWNVCQMHYEHPGWSQQPDSGTSGYSGQDFADAPMDPEEAAAFFEWMMEEVFMGRYSRAGRERFFYQRRGFGGLYRFSGGSSDYSSNGHIDNNTTRQKKEKEAFERRMREFELECEAEQRELDRVARQNKTTADRRASARSNAFELGRSGKSSAVRDLVEEFELDVNAPEKVFKNPKKSQPVEYETILHVASAHCNVDLVSFLLQKGADTAAVNKARLTPFHTSILSANIPIVQLFLALRDKSSAGCHPSKAAPDGRTPLQLAIASGSDAMVELMLKDATVHDVERCWVQPSIPISIKGILETKKGFVPRESLKGPTMSKKALHKLEIARKEAAQKEEKIKRIAEERARAAENMRRKEERAEKLAAEERAREALRQEREEKERVAAERNARLMEQEARRREVEALRKAEQELAQKKVEEESQRERVEREARQMAERGAHQKAETEARDKPARPTRQDKHKGRRGAETGRKGVIEEAPLKPEADHRTEERREIALEAKRAETLARLMAQAEEHERQREKREMGERPRSVDEATLRKRAEQSAQDKARHQRQKAEKAKVVIEKIVESSSAPSSNTTISDGQDSPVAVQKAKKHRRNPRRDTRNLHIPEAPITPTSLPSSPQIQPTATVYPHAIIPISPPMTPENLQTCAIPDDLFQYEYPMELDTRIHGPSMGRVSSELTEGYRRRGGFRGRDRGWRGGRGRRGRGLGSGTRGGGAV